MHCQCTVVHRTLYSMLLYCHSNNVILHEIVATRRRRFVGHILRLPSTRPASLAIQGVPKKRIPSFILG